MALIGRFEGTKGEVFEDAYWRYSTTGPARKKLVTAEVFASRAAREASEDNIYTQIPLGWHEVDPDQPEAEQIYPILKLKWDHLVDDDMAVT